MAKRQPHPYNPWKARWEAIMPKVALAHTLREGELLVSALDEGGALDVPHLRELREELVSFLDAVKELAAEQADLKARGQAITQQLRITRRRGQDLVIKTRAAIRGTLGHNNEFLVRFNIRPARRRTRDEAVGVRLFPRPDLLPAAGLASAAERAVSRSKLETPGEDGDVQES
jgi:hypothetical protein